MKGSKLPNGPNGDAGASSCAKNRIERLDSLVDHIHFHQAICERRLPRHIEVDRETYKTER